MIRDVLVWIEALIGGLKHLVEKFLAWVHAVLGNPSVLRDPDMLLWAGIVLVVLWLVSTLVVQLADAILHVALILGILLLASWVVLTYIV